MSNDEYTVIRDPRGHFEVVKNCPINGPLHYYVYPASREQITHATMDLPIPKALELMRIVDTHLQEGKVHNNA